MLPLHAVDPFLTVRWPAGRFEEGEEVVKAFERLHERYKERQGQEKQQALEGIVSAATLKQVLQVGTPTHAC